MAAWVLGVGGWAVFQVLGPMGMVGGSLTISSLEAAGLMCLGDSHLRGSMTAVVHSVWEGGACSLAISRTAIEVLACQVCECRMCSLTIECVLLLSRERLSRSWDARSLNVECVLLL